MSKGIQRNKMESDTLIDSQRSNVKFSLQLVQVIVVVSVVVRSFCWQKNQTNQSSWSYAVDEEAKSKHEALRCSWRDIICHQSFIVWSISLTFPINFSHVCKILKNLMYFFSSQKGSLWASDSENSSDVEKIFLKILSLVKRVQGVAV